ncbi:hypothetical protein KCG48_10525 [Proteiniclasticum sp. BAD-10]|uniref:Uncharacterized protein n=1 Tax=Proteiniclasticum sediminis TaxID=2804028 RepID=A0A941CR87_9CLOT|nr:hypothetical protein [Proteiniclasticum sediminis]MBR0576767.1 hypothetical protein [Proteiniclasticum sediminis]
MDDKYRIVMIDKNPVNNTELICDGLDEVKHYTEKGLAMGFHKIIIIKMNKK